MSNSIISYPHLKGLPVSETAERSHKRKLLPVSQTTERSYKRKVIPDASKKTNTKEISRSASPAGQQRHLKPVVVSKSRAPIATDMDEEVEFSDNTLMTT
jgi:hypothetical protein